MISAKVMVEYYLLLLHSVFLAAIGSYLFYY